MHVCLHIHIYMHIHINTHTYIYRYRYTHTCIYTYMHASIHLHYTHAHTHIYTQSHACTSTCTLKYTCMHTHTHMPSILWRTEPGSWWLQLLWDPGLQMYTDPPSWLGQQRPGDNTPPRWRSRSTAQGDICHPLSPDMWKQLCHITAPRYNPGV